MTDANHIALGDPTGGGLYSPPVRFREPIGNEHLERGAGGHFTREAVEELRDAKAAGWKPSWRRKTY